mmetsp:Transcript_13384/g.25123  ORF Transcript_13384/g.25123 Transcript_13384/m.25123 type:complete len:294 (+) Transcript_13384:69-950(+)
MPSFLIQPSTFFLRGMVYAGNNEKMENIQFNATNYSRFRSHYGTSPGVCAICWNQIANTLPQHMVYSHLLWALMFLKVYATESVLASKCGVDEKTYRDKVWTIVKCIASIKRRVIKLQNRFIGYNNLSTCLLTVDGTDFRIPEPTPFWSGWFSHKFKGPGLRYEVGLNIQNGWICWIKGPFAPGPWSDIKIFRGWLKWKLSPRERVEADHGYRGDFRAVCPNQCGNLEEYRMKMNARARHETVNRRLKQFNCLKYFRHDKQLHVHCFNAIAVITQLAIANGEPLYHVQYKIVY